MGITPGSKVEFDVAGGGARLKLVKKHTSSRIEEGAAIARSFMKIGRRVAEFDRGFAHGLPSYIIV